MSHNDAAIHDKPLQPKHVQFQPSSPKRDSPRDSGLKSSLDHKEDTLDEQSPLLPPRTSDDVGHVPSLSTVMSPTPSSQGEAWNADSGKKEASRSSWYLLLLTISIGG
jgi:solute carrier family 45 protein 1/2/4